MHRTYTKQFTNLQSLVYTVVFLRVFVMCTDRTCMWACLCLCTCVSIRVCNERVLDGPTGDAESLMRRPTTSTRKWENWRGSAQLKMIEEG